jgi:hypothetical protein
MPLEPEGDDSVEFDVQSIDQGAVEPTYRSDDARKAAPIWAQSQTLREVLDRGQRGEPLSEKELQGLRSAVLRQLPTLGLYRQLSLMRQGPMAAAGKRDQDIGLGGNVGLYVLVFPGEAKDNTGIKDLNDKVLGYELNSEWIALRQKAVADIFWQKDATPPPKWITVGQDYKTAYILPVGKTAKDFADDLIAFDKKLKEYLLAILEKAEKDAKKKKDQNRLKAISDLRKRLNKKEVYRFPYIYGFSVLPLHDDKTISLTLRLVTEALKAAAVVRWAEKRDDLTQRPAKQTASVAPVPRHSAGPGRPRAYL